MCMYVCVCVCVSVAIYIGSDYGSYNICIVFVQERGLLFLSYRVTIDPMANLTIAPALASLAV